MGGKTSSFLRDTFRDTKRYYSETLQGGGISRKAGHEIKEGWDDARGATKKNEQTREAARVAAIPKAEGLTDQNQLEDAKRRKGRSSTRIVGRRQPLGGGSSLT